MKNDTAQAEMPRYKCHKEVHALRIADIEYCDSVKHGVQRFEYCLLIPFDSRYSPIRVSSAWMNKHQPDVGGYYVVYSDGYASYSPKTTFEEGYSLI